MVLQASTPWPFLDYHRMPYEVTAAPAGWPGFLGRVLGSSGRSLLWPRAEKRAELGAGCVLGRYRLGDSWLVGHAVTDASAAEWLPRVGEAWRPVRSLRGPDAGSSASVWQDAHGCVFLPFDMGEVMENLWSERYREVQRSYAAALARTALLRGYYALKPAVPREAQLALRRQLARRQGRSAFPRWPVEDSLDDLYTWLLGVLAEVHGAPLPSLAPWPGGRTWALVLTHDVENQAGFRTMHLLRDQERPGGFRSSWNFVPGRYDVSSSAIEQLRDEGCEIGVHGLLHDGRDLGSRKLLEQRLPAIREYAARWKAVGFRSPATQRTWEWMPDLGFDYDSSYTDTDPFEPQPGGCCTYLPFVNRDLVELPITLPQDHTLFAILGHPDGQLWLDKVRHLRDRGAMALVLTHPDYAVDPRIPAAYRALLDDVRDDPGMWHALPSEVTSWWRRRAASTVTGRPGAWTVRGPAAGEATVRLTVPSGGAMGLAS